MDLPDFKPSSFDEWLEMRGYKEEIRQMFYSTFDVGAAYIAAREQVERWRVEYVRLYVI